ncbi:hypothetical protein [Microviridae sp.]|nr:hypothetical protein [Microviridae sp.]
MKLPKRYGKPDPEELDDTPIEMPIGSMRPTPLQDLIANMVREAMVAEAGDEFETMDEASDFEEEDPDVLDMSPYTLTDLELEEELPQEPAPQQVEQNLASELNQTGDPPDPNAEEPDQP